MAVYEIWATVTRSKKNEAPNRRVAEYILNETIDEDDFDHAWISELENQGVELFD